MPARGDRAEHRRAEQHRLAGLGAPTRLPVASAMIWRTSGLRPAPPLTTSIRSRIRPPRACATICAEPLGEPGQAGDIELSALLAVAQVEADDRAARRRIGVGRAIAEEVGQDMHVPGEPRRGGSAAGALDDLSLHRGEIDRAARGIGRRPD